MDKCREAFEKLPEINAILHNSEFGFNEDINQYYHPNHTEHRLNYAFLMGAWSVWQSRQAEVDLISATHNGQMIGHDVFVKQLKERHGKQVQGLAKAISKFEKEMDEKDKRIEELESRIKNQIETLKCASKSWVYTEREQNIMLSQAVDLEKALRGNDAN